MVARKLRSCVVLLGLAGAATATGVRAGEALPKAVFRAGAAAVDVSPVKLPVIVSGGFFEGVAHRVCDPLFARAMVLDDGATRLALVVVDNLMLPRELVDEAKRRAERSTKIPADRMMISATHTHSAPSVMGALGTGVDRDYARWLPDKIAQSIVAAAGNLEPAQVGWTTVVDDRHTHCRRWIYRPDRMASDPFGEQTVRAMMHPGYQNPDFLGPAGPADPELSLLAVRSADGRPLALVANYSMHYFGAEPVSADYFGRFSRKVAAQACGNRKVIPPMVVMMSQGTAGDLHWMDYRRPAKSISIDAYADEVARVALDAYKTIRYRDGATLAMAQTKLTLLRRTPDAKRLAWARSAIAAMQNRTKPRSLPEVYALEQLYLHNEPQRELVLQAARVGDLGITAIPCEVFGLTGLKIKAQSPLRPTLNIELANGGDGYIPPPEQHELGGYTTWPARTAGLEVQAEPKIVDAVLSLLEQVAGKPRRTMQQPRSRYVQALLDAKPVALWRLADVTKAQALDATGAHHGAYEGGVAFYLDGPLSPGPAGVSPNAGPSSPSSHGSQSSQSSQSSQGRAVQFAGGRMAVKLPRVGSQYSVELWFCNMLPNDARLVTGYFFSRGEPWPWPGPGSEDVAGDALGIGGTHMAAGRLLLYNGNGLKQCLRGVTPIAPHAWNHVVLVRDGADAAVYLNGRREPEIRGELPPGNAPGESHFFLGGRNDNFANFEGRMADAALFDRVLSPDEVAAHYAAAQQ